jgi:hypothetical protein
MLKYLTVEVRCVDGLAAVKPDQFVLDGSFDAVVWWCVNPPKHAKLEIRFDSGGGPFAGLEPNGPFIVGSGNVGTRPDNKYRYHVRVEAPGAIFLGEGRIINLTQAQGPDHEIVCDPSSGPPRCWDDRKP